MRKDFQNLSSEDLARWNDEMVLKYHKEGTLFESKNLILRLLEIMRLKKMIRVGKIKKKDTILDLGCGEGFLISFLPEKNKIIGVDISKVALKRAKNFLAGKKNFELKYGDAQNLKIPNETFDKIFCSEMLEHLPNPKKAIEEIRRVLKKNGLAIISVPDEKRIQSIMRIVKILSLNKFLHSARKTEDYEWHLHQADKQFIFDISKGLFKIKKICRTPLILGYRFIAILKKI